MTNLKLFMMPRDGVTTQLVPNPPWKWLSDNNQKVYFHPDEEGHAFVGDMLFNNYNIKFIPFNDRTPIFYGENVFFLVHREPEGLWIDSHRWAEPAKGTRVR